MPYPFVLPTTSSFSFSSSFSCESHPSLLLNASTHRGVGRETLKKHKRLPPNSQAPNLSSVVSSLNGYLPYLFAVDAGLSHRAVQGDEMNVVLRTAPAMEWRPTLSEGPVPGKEAARVRVQSLEYEIFFALSTLAIAHSLQARVSLHPLYLTSTAPVGTQQRQVAVTSATQSLLNAASIFDYLATRAEGFVTTPPCADISAAAVRAQASLALAEATLLAVLKDDPYPAVVAQDRNQNDTEWMYKAPDMPKVRAHLFARLCLAAGEHAAQAHSLSAGRVTGGKVSQEFVRYLEDLRRTSRAKACRFFGIDAEIGGQTGTAIAWLYAGLQELGVERKEAKKSSGFGKLKKEWAEKREDRRIEKGANWGVDAGRLEETRVIEMLEAKWTKQNDTMLTQTIPPTGPLLAQMPSGREIHSIKPFQPPVLDAATLEAMRAPPERSDDFEGYPSSDEETLAEPVGAFPGTSGDYRTGTPNYY
ncbi:pH-response regulator protein palC [Immersiella caudata]|uniref:pH-response regulator protein palC n=1 Tax=Immersiella caudata TaxID=314043 RepID=A0AA39XFP4_9PEZI|nr:pH-response regulator protein palC [Immersiella caudata]